MDFQSPLNQKRKGSKSCRAPDDTFSRSMKGLHPTSPYHRKTIRKYTDGKRLVPPISVISPRKKHDRKILSGNKSSTKLLNSFKLEKSGISRDSNVVEPRGMELPFLAEKKEELYHLLKVKAINLAHQDSRQVIRSAGSATLSWNSPNRSAKSTPQLISRTLNGSIKEMLSVSETKGHSSLIQHSNSSHRTDKRSNVRHLGESQHKIKPSFERAIDITKPTLPNHKFDLTVSTKKKSHKTDKKAGISRTPNVVRLVAIGTQDQTRFSLQKNPFPEEISKFDQTSKKTSTLNQPNQCVLHSKTTVPDSIIQSDHKTWNNRLTAQVKCVSNPNRTYEMESNKIQKSKVHMLHGVLTHAPKYNTQDGPKFPVSQPVRAKPSLPPQTENSTSQSNSNNSQLRSLSEQKRSQPRLVSIEAIGSSVLVNPPKTQKLTHGLIRSCSHSPTRSAPHHSLRQSLNLLQRHSTAESIPTRPLTLPLRPPSPASSAEKRSQSCERWKLVAVAPVESSIDPSVRNCKGERCNKPLTRTNFRTTSSHTMNEAKLKQRPCTVLSMMLPPENPHLVYKHSCPISGLFSAGNEFTSFLKANQREGLTKTVTTLLTPIKHTTASRENILPSESPSFDSSSGGLDGIQQNSKLETSVTSDCFITETSTGSTTKESIFNETLDVLGFQYSETPHGDKVNTLSSLCECNANDSSIASSRRDGFSTRGGSTIANMTVPSGVMLQTTIKTVQESARAQKKAVLVSTPPKRHESLNTSPSLESENIVNVISNTAKPKDLKTDDTPQGSKTGKTPAKSLEHFSADGEGISEMDTFSTFFTTKMYRPPFSNTLWIGESNDTTLQPTEMKNSVQSNLISEDVVNGNLRIKEGTVISRDPMESRGGSFVSTPSRSFLSTVAAMFGMKQMQKNEVSIGPGSVQHCRSQESKCQNQNNSLVLTKDIPNCNQLIDNCNIENTPHPFNSLVTTQCQNSPALMDPQYILKLVPTSNPMITAVSNDLRRQNENNDIPHPHQFRDFTKVLQDNDKSSNLVFNNNASSPENTLIIWDWDDTILPTYHLAVEHRLNLTDAYIPDDIRSPLADLECRALQSLELSMKSGCTILVTNASFRWLTDSAEKYFPKLWEFIKEHKVKILSARDLCQSLGLPQPDWKKLLIKDQVEDFFRHLDVPATDVANMVKSVKNIRINGELIAKFRELEEKKYCNNVSGTSSPNGLHFYANNLVPEERRLDQFTRRVTEIFHLHPKIIAMTGLLLAPSEEFPSEDDDITSKVNQKECFEEQQVKASIMIDKYDQTNEDDVLYRYSSIVLDPMFSKTSDSSSLFLPYDPILKDDDPSLTSRVQKKFYKELHLQRLLSTPRQPYDIKRINLSVSLNHCTSPTTATTSPGYVVSPNTILQPCRNPDCTDGMTICPYHDHGESDQELVGILGSAPGTRATSYVRLANGTLISMKDLFPRPSNELGLSPVPCSVISIGDGIGEREAVLSVMTQWDQNHRAVLQYLQELKDYLYLEIFKPFVESISGGQANVLNISPPNFGKCEGARDAQKSCHSKLRARSAAWSFKALKLAPHPDIEQLYHTHEKIQAALKLILQVKHSIDATVEEHLVDNDINKQEERRTIQQGHRDTQKQQPLQSSQQKHNSRSLSSIKADQLSCIQSVKESPQLPHESSNYSLLSNPHYYKTMLSTHSSISPTKYQQSSQSFSPTVMSSHSRQSRSIFLNEFHRSDDLLYRCTSPTVPPIPQQ